MSAIDERLAERRAKLADAERAARRQRLAALERNDRVPNGEPPRVMPNQPIPGEEPDLTFAY